MVHRLHSQEKGKERRGGIGVHECSDHMPDGEYSVKSIQNTTSQSSEAQASRGDYKGDVNLMNLVLT